MIEMQWETGIRLWRWGNAVSCFGVVQFLCLCLLATAAYPGGTIAEHNTAGYSFSENFLSDLGRSVAWCGESNTTAQLLFATMQKYVVLGAVGWYLIFGIRMVLTTDLRPTRRDATVDYTAEQLAAWLKRGNWRVRRPAEGPRKRTPRSPRA
jgi:hypothetical protein